MVKKHVRHLRPVLYVCGLCILGIALIVMLNQTFSRDVPSVETPISTPKNAPFMLTSPVFEQNGLLPKLYTCNEVPHSPPLAIQNPPSNTKEFALVLRNIDDQDKAYWVAWNIPATTTFILDSSLPSSAVSGLNDLMNNGYTSPCATEEKPNQRLVFDLYALSDTILLPENATKDQLISVINGRVISKVQLNAKIGSSTPN